jgi:hypothetical protein
MTKNLTLAVDEADLTGARIYAAKRSTTVNALVRNYIASLNSDEERRRREAIERMIERSRSGPKAESGGKITRGWGDHDN